MNTLVVMAAILFLLMVAVGGGKGARSFIALFFNFVVLLFAIFIMLDPSANIILVTIIASAAISCITLFYINEVNSTTKTAFLSTVITIVLLISLIVFLTETAMIQGFSEEEVGELYIFSFYIGIDFMKIAAAVIIMSTIGAITDMAIAIASPMREIFYHHPTITKKELFKSGLSIGRDILGTNTNTLFFAFFGGYLALLIWFKDLDYSTGQIVNSKVFTEEIITIMCAGIGIAIIIPITSWITAYVLMKAGLKKEEEIEGSE
ncbi:YibE/F family protein [Radiobacillus sp. PE A8.2]|uniref:YibE/F family protein n=1 Tax=Radiobacillus sp. PE A8.2 TaxID=3380349 RepID=UPI00388F58CB